ncbi:class I SAM-dependent methyltransferase [Oceanobacter kriegii]|uniref:class I SAM-dependent methyltransferase n=1 Tax=Oceanobacter kriegii TaxID=64972 RepID=UPI000404E781|nr:50S ribosomal protein L11 methyltransferase [Oceanobacter kriegii]
MSLQRLQGHLSHNPGWHHAELAITLLQPEQLRLALLQVDDQQCFAADQIADIWQRLPFWAFAWAGGRAMSQWLAANPQPVQGKQVLDFGCGSGMAAVQALKAGAERVWVMDIDPHALEAAQYNAQLNGVTIDVWQQDSFPPADVFLAGDILYDPGCRPLLRQLLDAIPAGYLAEPTEALRLYAGASPENGGQKAAFNNATFNNDVAAVIRHIASFDSSTLPVIGDFDEHVGIDIVGVEPGAAE